MERPIPPSKFRTVAEWVARSRAEQGLPPRVADTGALRQIAAILATPALTPVRGPAATDLRKNQQDNRAGIPRQPAQPSSLRALTVPRRTMRPHAGQIAERPAPPD